MTFGFGGRLGLGLGGVVGVVGGLGVPSGTACGGGEGLITVDVPGLMATFPLATTRARVCPADLIICCASTCFSPLQS